MTTAFKLYQALFAKKWQQTMMPTWVEARQKFDIFV